MATLSREARLQHEAENGRLRPQAGPGPGSPRAQRTPQLVEGTSRLVRGAHGDARGRRIGLQCSVRVRVSSWAADRGRRVRTCASRPPARRRARPSSSLARKARAVVASPPSALPAPPEAPSRASSVSSAASSTVTASTGGAGDACRASPRQTAAHARQRRSASCPNCRSSA